MSSLRFCFLVAVLCSCSHLGHGDPITSPPKPVTIDVPHPSVTPPIILPLLEKNTELPLETSNSNAESSKLSTTEKLDVETTYSSSSNPEPSSNPSPKPPSPSPEPPSPTPAPAPSPTPTPAPAPTPAPGPVPSPDQGLWPFTDKKENVTCVIVQFAAQLNVTYTKLVENVTSLAYVLVNVPKNATVSNGSCDGVDQWLTINWTAPGTQLTNNMTLVFHKNATMNNYGLKSLNVSLTPELFYNISSKDVIELYHGVDWRTPLTTSYRCSAPTRLNMTSDSASTVAALTLSRLQEEAFRNVPGNEFSAARECGGGDVPDAVPIAVGCALGGLVLVVLGAYLVARRRSAARGYLSM